MARKSLIAALVAMSLAGSPTAALAGAYPVYDAQAFAKLADQIKQAKKDFANQLEQLEKLKEQLSWLNKISSTMNQVSDAIGEAASVVLPITSIDNIRSQIQSDAACLMPDGVSWGIGLDDLDLATICDLSTKYKSALFADEESLKDKTIPEQNRVRATVARRRDALLADTASRALAQGDKQLDKSKALEKAAAVLEKKADDAGNTNAHLAVANKIAVARLAADAQRNQMLAQMLRLQAAIAVKAGLGADEVAQVMSGKKESE